MPASTFAMKSMRHVDFPTAECHTEPISHHPTFATRTRRARSLAMAPCNIPPKFRVSNCRKPWKSSFAANLLSDSLPSETRRASFFSSARSPRCTGRRPVLQSAAGAECAGLENYELQGVVGVLRRRALHDADAPRRRRVQRSVFCMKSRTAGFEAMLKSSGALRSPICPPHVSRPSASPSPPSTDMTARHRRRHTISATSASKTSLVTTSGAPMSVQAKALVRSLSSTATGRRAFAQPCSWTCGAIIAASRRRPPTKP